MKSDTARRRGIKKRPRCWMKASALWRELCQEEERMMGRERLGLRLRGRDFVCSDGPEGRRLSSQPLGPPSRDDSSNAKICLATPFLCHVIFVCIAVLP